MNIQVIKNYLVLTSCIVSSLFAARLKDIASLKGVRSNQLIGYGIVIGLDGTGDKNFDLTNQSLVKLLKNLGLDMKGEGLSLKNVASVLISVDLPSFAKEGQNLDVTVAVVGTATSLEHGILLPTPLKGPDDTIYAMAQGPIQEEKVSLTKGGGGGGGASQGKAKNMLVAKVPLGARIEREIQQNWSTMRELTYQLSTPDFTTSARVAVAINTYLSGKYASPMDASSIELQVPYYYHGNTIDLIASLENIDVDVDNKAKVIVDSKSGTVVFGKNVQILPVVISKSGLHIEIGEENDSTQKKSLSAPGASQDNSKPPSDSQKVTQTQNPTAPQTDVQNQKSLSGKKSNSYYLIHETITLSDLVDTMNQLGIDPAEIQDVLRTLKKSGALLADLEINE